MGCYIASYFNLHGIDNITTYWTNTRLCRAAWRPRSNLFKQSCCRPIFCFRYFSETKRRLLCLKEINLSYFILMQLETVSAMTFGKCGQEEHVLVLITVGKAIRL